MKIIIEKGENFDSIFDSIQGALMSLEHCAIKVEVIDENLIKKARLSDKEIVNKVRKCVGSW